MKCIARLCEIIPLYEPAGVRYSLCAIVETGNLSTMIDCDVFDFDLTEANIKARWKDAVAARIVQVAAESGMTITVSAAEVRIP